jgi:DNA-binding XRE family transcriptional regulator
MAKAPKKPKKTPAPRQPFAELPPALDIKKLGRPTTYDESFCELVLELGAAGKSKAQMAASIGVARKTMTEWEKVHPEFGNAVKAAQDLALSWWEDAGQRNMTRMGFNATAYIFQMKNRFRADYSEKVDVRHDATAAFRSVWSALASKGRDPVPTEEAA